MMLYLLIELVKLMFMILSWLLQLWLIPWIYQFLLDFLVAPSKKSSSIEIHLDHLKIGSNIYHDLIGNIFCVIMTDEGSTLVKVASSISGYNHYLCSFHVNQLAVGISSFIFFMLVHLLIWVHFMLFIYLNIISWSLFFKCINALLNF